MVLSVSLSAAWCCAGAVALQVSWGLLCCALTCLHCVLCSEDARVTSIIESQNH